jgi:hypothetical protein
VTTSNTFLFLALVSVVWGVVSSIRIAAWLQRRGVEVSFIFFRLLVLKYVHQYRRMSQAEFGQPGPLFFHYIIAMNTALVCAVIGLASR